MLTFWNNLSGANIGYNNGSKVSVVLLHRGTLVNCEKSIKSKIVKKQFEAFHGEDVVLTDQFKEVGVFFQRHRVELG